MLLRFKKQVMSGYDEFCQDFVRSLRDYFFQNSFQNFENQESEFLEAGEDFLQN